MTDALQRMRELSVQAQNGTNGTGDRANLDTEFQQLSAEITRIASQTKFNGVAIVGAGAGAQVFQIGPNNGDTLTVTTATVTTVTGSVSTAAAASTALAAIDTALDSISTNRATYGAAMSRFGFAISNLQITGENQTAARGRIMDADFAMETANLSRAQILQQAGNAMVAQANQLPQQVMALLRN
jgi:flagellin